MENKNKPETWEIDEVIGSEDAESNKEKLDMPETFEINDDGTIREKREKTLEEKEESVEEKESNGSAEEINLIFSDIENYNKKYQETSQKEEKRQGLWAKLTGGKAKETEEIKSREKEAQEIYKRLEEIEEKYPDVFEKQRKELIEIFRKEAGEIAEKRAEKVDEAIEGLNEETSKEIEKVNKEKPGLFERISARFKKNGLEIVIALSLLAMLAAMPRENALELITSGRIKSFLPIEYANLGLIASTAAVLKIANSDFITRNIRKYFGDKTLKETKEEQEDLPTSIDGSSDEKVTEGTVGEVEPEASKDDVEGEGVEVEKTKKKKKEPKNKKYDKSFNQVAGSAEYQEAFRKYQEEGDSEVEENSEESLEKKDENKKYDKSSNQVAGSAEYQEAFRKHQEEGEDEETQEEIDQERRSGGDYEEPSSEKESLITEKELEILNFIKNKVAKGEEAELKFKGDFGWYATDIKEEKGKRPMISIRKKQGNDAKVINVDLSKIEKAKK
ncbi:MAG: hypothetical protein PWQ56_16 [Patescibacteria group bacterium]|nr:hypothetical protein [Patescibacteria group bacterium]